MSAVFEVGSEYDWMSNQSFLMETENNLLSGIEPKRLRLLRNGRDALRYIARAFKGRIDTVLMPALSCACMSEVFQSEGYRVIYYKLHSDYVVNVPDVLSRLTSSCFFLYMNYFAIPSISADEISQIKNAEENVLTIEDITHEFLNRKPESFAADFTVCSVRKWLAMPDGGFLVSKEPLDNVLTVDDDSFARIRKTAMLEKSIYLQSGLPELKESFRTKFSKANEFIDTALTIGKIDGESVSVLGHFDMDQARILRRQNVDLLHGALKDFEGIRLMNKDSAISPLYFPILVEEQDAVQKLLAGCGVYAPVIWPLVPDAENVCAVADYTAKHMLAIPCDHRYSQSDILRIIDIVKTAMQSV